MIHFQEISKVFKADLFVQPFVALDKVSFQIPEGSMVGFLGANGAGKTTSLKIIMDFIRPTSGEVKFDPKLGKTNFEVFKNIGFLPERPYFYPNLKGREFLELMGKISEVPTSLIKQRIQYWGPRFKIDYALEREIKTYSKGMLQRIGFLATVLHEPKIIILDEPLSGLDPIGRKEIKDVIVEVHNQGKTVFFSSHIVPDIEEICDRVVFLKEGKLVYDGSVGALIREGVNPTYEIKVMSDKVNELQTSCLHMKQMNDGSKLLEVEASLKMKLIEELCTKGIDIVGVDSKKPSLEEIFYQIKE